MSEEEIRKKWAENPMLKPRIEKVTVNISVGASGEPLEKATKVLKQLTGQEPCKRKAKKTIRDFCLSRGLGDVYKRQPFSCITLKTRPNSFEAGPITHSRLFLNSLFRIVVSPFARVSIIVKSSSASLTGIF